MSDPDAGRFSFSAMTKKNKNTKNDPNAPLATNRKAMRDYTVLERIETGIVLAGTEVKSVRNRQLSLDESFARIENREVWLVNLHINPYDFGNQFNHDTRRKRKLLLHRREIDRLIGQTQIKGLALIPLKIYLKHGRIKAQLGLCKGKHQHDKRETIKRKTADREAERAIARVHRK